jgi:hypothetical protein
LCIYLIHLRTASPHRSRCRSIVDAHRPPICPHAHAHELEHQHEAANEHAHAHAKIITHPLRAHATLQACAHACTHAGPQVRQHSLDLEFSFVSSDDEQGHTYIAMASDGHSSHVHLHHAHNHQQNACVCRRICVNARMQTHARTRTDFARAYAHILTQTDLHT